MKQIFLLLACCAIGIAARAQTNIITTLAGNGTAGYAGDGGLASATTVEFNNPTFVTMDGSGNIYIVDKGNSCIRKITAATGIISTIAGTGTAGYNGDGILATAAQLSGPFCLAFDGSGNIFITDDGNSRVRKIDNLGYISTVTGPGTITSFYDIGDGGPATDAVIEGCTGIAVDSYGNIYFGSNIRNIRKISSGIITSIVGPNTLPGVGAYGYGDGGPATAATTQGAYDLKVDASGTIFIADFGEIRTINSSNYINEFAGTFAEEGFYSGDGGPSTASVMGTPTGVSLDGCGNVFIADPDGSVIRKVNSAGIISKYASTAAGAETGYGGAMGYSGDGGPATLALLNRPTSVASDPSGNIYIADAGNNVIRKVTNGLLSLSTTLSIAGTAMVCSGTAATLSITGGTSSAVITLYPGGTTFTLDGFGSGSVAVSPATTTAYYGTITDGSCTYPTRDTFRVTVTPPPSAITGASSVCVGLHTTLSDATTGGTWSCSNSNATISSSGVATGVTAGTDTVTYTVGSGCIVTKIITVLPTGAGSITGATSLCGGTHITLSDAVTGGTWHSSNTAVATVSTGGVVTGVAAGGAVTISYTATNSCGTSTATYSVTVNPAPNAGVITGPTYVCAGSSTTLADAVAGGTWSGSDPGFITVSSTGVVTGVNRSGRTVSYTVTNSCGSATATRLMHICGFPTLTGAPNLCVGETITLHGVPGASGTGTSSHLWSGVVPAEVTTTYSGTSDGVYTGLSAGTHAATYTYTYTGDTVNYCAGSVFTPVTIFSASTVPVLSGSNTVCAGDTIHLTASIAYGNWSSVRAATATSVNLGVTRDTGLITGVSPDTVTIKYAGMGSGCTTPWTATKLITVIHCGPRESNPTAIDDTKETDDIKVYPNPNTGMFTVELPTVITNASINITDQSGKSIISRSTTEKKVSIDLSSYPAGMYLLSINAGDRVYHDKVVIE